MTGQLPKKIVLMGAGRVSRWLAARLFEKKLATLQIYNRTAAAGEALAQSVQATFTDKVHALDTDADLYLIAVRDDAIAEVAEKLASQQPAGLVCHLSGATSSAVLLRHFARCGVFWMPQTFSAHQTPRRTATPVCIDAALLSDVIMLEKFARKLGLRPHRVDESQRAQLHLAAVFANNFSNHCLVIAEKLVRECGLDFEILYPIIRTTFEKALQGAPSEHQTGPAKRGDSATIQQHLQLLATQPHWQKIYALLSEDIAALSDTSRLQPHHTSVK